MILRGAAVMLMLAMVACASAPSTSAPARPNREAEARSTSAPGTKALFDLHVGFWVNLHQRLYAESGLRPPPDTLRATTTADQEAWDGAVSLYRRRYPERRFSTLLENPELVFANRRLAELEQATDLAAAGFPTELRGALETAAPVYRRLLWPADQRAGRAFQEHLTSLLQQRAGEPIARELGRAYETPWPSSPVRVDVAAFAGPTGAYTMTETATHITIASRDPRHLGDTALELIFHEASHALVGRVEASIVRACQAQGKPVPPTLWHAVLFYATGEIVKRQLGPAYKPYAYQNGLYARNPSWAAAEPLLAQHGPAYLDGRQSLDATIDQLVMGLR